MTGADARLLHRLSGPRIRNPTHIRDGGVLFGNRDRVRHDGRHVRCNFSLSFHPMWREPHHTPPRSIHRASHATMESGLALWSQKRSRLRRMNSLWRGGRYHRQDASVTTIVLLGTARYSSEQHAAHEKKDCWKWKHLACIREIRQRRLEAACQWTISTVINQIVAGNNGSF